MTGYTKLFGSILDSSLWVNETKETRLVWITLLAMSDRHGEVSASIPGLAARAKVSIPEVETALAAFTAPDPYSRTKDFEGRRIEAIDGGWVLLNHAKYRAEMSEDDIRIKAAERQKRYRERRKSNVTVTLRNVTGVTSDASNDMQKQKQKQNAEAIKTVPSGTVAKRFEKPTIEAMNLHCAKIGLPETESVNFFNYYESNGWRVGRNPMKSWEAALVNWKIRWNERNAQKSSQPDWKKRMAIEEAINNHPANPASIKWSKSRPVTQEELAGLKDLRAKLAALTAV